MIDDNHGAIGGMDDWQGSQSTRRKPALVPLWPPQILHLTCPGLKPGLPRWDPATNRMSYGTGHITILPLCLRVNHPWHCRVQSMNSGYLFSSFCSFPVYNIPTPMPVLNRLPSGPEPISTAYLIVWQLSS
jgi:hypothetical protein